jgi:hypothetical protein
MSSLRSHCSFRRPRNEVTRSARPLIFSFLSIADEFLLGNSQWTTIGFGTHSVEGWLWSDYAEGRRRVALVTGRSKGSVMDIVL